MNNYFCVLPFYGAEYTTQGISTPCCLLPPSTDIPKLQTDILLGKRSDACKKCWSLEDQHIVSDRQLKNSAFDYFINKDITNIEEDCRNGLYQPQIIKLYTSNICNSTCVTCDEGSSSAWATLRKTKTFQIINDDIIDNLPINNIVMLDFVGGEPFYEKKNFVILEELIKIGNTDCFISFVTNGSTLLSEYQKNIISQFKNLNICLSIDGVGPVFEYMRYPLKWDLLLDNIKFYRTINAHLSVSYTISNVNILYYNETITWFKEQGLQHNHIIVSSPGYFSPSALPLFVKEQLNTPLGLASNHTKYDDDQFALACAEIKKQDLLKKINIKDYMPKFYNILN